MKKNILILVLLTNIALADFIRNSSTEIVLDSSSSLMWQDSSEAKTITKTWSDAITYCEALNLPGHSDWRLPNINELTSIVNLSKRNLLKYNAFVNIVSEYYWSSTTYIGTSKYDYAFQVNFRNGMDNKHKKTDNYYVLCVWGGN